MRLPVIVMALLRLTRGVILEATAVFFVVALIFAVWLENAWFIRHLGVFPGPILFAAAREKAPSPT